MMHEALHDSESAVWQLGRGREITLDQPRLIGILNVTPDSFSDGGHYANPARAVGWALRMINEGASIIDIGGESTRPGAVRVDVEEQIARTVPIIEELHRHADVIISIDTTQSEVARAALDAGAHVINDVSAGQEDEDLFTLAAERQCGLVLMHRRVAPERDSYSDQYETPPAYDDVVNEVGQFLRERAQAARQAGVGHDAIAVDPGLGFGKTVSQNYELIARAGELLETGYPVVSAASRKSFIGAVSEVDEPAERLYGTLAASVAQCLAGVRLFRVHDVGAHAQALAVAQAIGARPMAEKTPG